MNVDAKNGWESELAIEKVTWDFERRLRARDATVSIESVLKKHPELPAEQLFRTLLDAEIDLRQSEESLHESFFHSLRERFPQFPNSFWKELEAEIQADGSRTEAPADILHADQEFDSFRVCKPLGFGATSVVYLAQRISSEDRVAIKIMRPDVAESLGKRRRVFFQTEREVSEKLAGDLTARYYGSGTYNELPYLVMELIDGQPLDEFRDQSNAVPLAVAARIIASAAETIHAAHMKGVIHRDLKPQNIIVSGSGTPVITDFGAALVYEQIGRGGRYAGTPRYMSPEQAKGSSQLVDGRSDVYSLGVILYELLTGTHPYGDQIRSPVDLLVRIECSDAPPLRQRMEIDKKLESICLKAIQREPKDRYQTAADFAASLRNYLWRHRVKRVAAMPAVGLCFAMVLGAMAWLGGSVVSDASSSKSGQIAKRSTDGSTVTNTTRGAQPLGVRTMLDRLRQQPNPTFETSLLASFPRTDIAVYELVNSLRSEANAEVRRFLVLALARISSFEMTDHDKERVIFALNELSAREQSSSVLAAIEACYSAMGLSEEQFAKQKTFAGASYEYQRYETIGEQKMIVLQTEDLVTGKGHKFAISQLEITVDDWDWLTNAWNARSTDGPANRLPKNFMSWHDAARFCNLLSEVCGYPESEYCFETCLLPDGSVGYRAAPDFLGRRGFRMPTSAEWWVASCGSENTDRFFGDSIDHLALFANCQPHSSETLSKVGSLFPNQAGLFDTLGNVSEWLMDHPDGETSEPFPPESFYIVGGSAFTSAGDVTEELRYETPARQHSPGVGLRVAQSIVPTNKPKPFSLVVESFDHGSGVRKRTDRIDDFGHPVQLGQFCRGELPRCNLRITNTDSTPLEIRSFSSEGPFTVIDLIQEPLKPGASASIEVSLNAVMPRKQTGVLRWTTMTGVQEISDHRLRLSGYIKGPALHFIGATLNDELHATLDLGILPVGGEARQTVSLFNEGDSPLIVESIKSHQVTVQTKGRIGEDIASGTILEVLLDLDSSEAQLIEDLIEIRTNDPLRPKITIQVRAEFRDLNGFATIGVFRRGAWLFDRDRDGDPDETFDFGMSNDTPFCGDFDGDGLRDYCVSRSSTDKTRTWEISFGKALDAAPVRINFGSASATPLVLDRNGDGKTDLAVVLNRDSAENGLLWEFDLDLDGSPEESVITSGNEKDIPIAGDWNADGTVDLGLYKPGADVSGVSVWHLGIEDSDVSTSVLFGLIEDRPIVGDWNADGKCDIGVCREYPTTRVIYLDLNRDREPEMELRFGNHGDKAVVFQP